MIYLVGEALLLALDSHYTEPVDILSVTRILRSVILLILFGTMVISQATPIECRRGDEEEVPLLQGHNNCTRGNDSHPYYGTIAQTQAPNGQSEDVQSDQKHFRYRIAVCTSQEKVFFFFQYKGQADWMQSFLRLSFGPAIDPTFVISEFGCVLS